MVFFKKWQMVSVFIILASVLTICLFLNFDVILSVNIARDYVCYFSMFVQYFLPLILFIFSFRIKRESLSKKEFNKFENAAFKKISKPIVKGGK